MLRIANLSYKDGLATIHEASQEAYNVVSRLSIKARSWFVQEQ
jgi:hypothetical protein